MLISLERFIGGSVVLAVVVVALAVGAGRVRTRLVPEADGVLAVVVDAVLALAMLLLIGHVLGAVGLLYPGLLSALATAAGIAAWWLLPPRREAADGARTARPEITSAAVLSSIPLALVAIVWVARAIATLDRGTAGNVDTYWYHMPLAARFAAQHDISGLFQSTDPVIGLYAADGSLLHAMSIQVAGGDVLAPLINLGFLALALLSAAAIGRTSGAGLLAPAAVAVVMLAPVMRAGQPGEAKDDIIMLALLLAGAAIVACVPLRPGAMAVVGGALGMAVGVKVTGLAAAAALAVGAAVLAPAAMRARGAGLLALAALVTGAPWYLRNLVEAGSPFPFVRLPGWDPPASPALDGPWSNAVVHYATDFGVWSDHFRPGLEGVLGRLWFVVIAAAAAGAVVGALRGGRARVLALAAGVAFAAYLTSPTTAGGPEGNPALFPYQVRHGAGALLLGLLAGAWSVGRMSPRVRAGLAAAIAVLGLAALRRADGQPPLPAWSLAVAVALLLALVLVAVLPGRRRLAAAGAVAVAAVVIVGARYRDGAYLRGDFAGAPALQTGSHTQVLVTLFDWSRGVEDSRIGVVGTFHQYPFYGRDLSNRVEQVGLRLPHGGFDETPSSCQAFADAVNSRGYDYVVTVPRGVEYVAHPVPDPERRWLDRATGAHLILGTFSDDAGAVHAIDGDLRCAH